MEAFPKNKPSRHLRAPAGIYVVLVSLLLTLNIFYTPCPSVSKNIEHAIAGWEATKTTTNTTKKNKLKKSHLAHKSYAFISDQKQ